LGGDPVEQRVERSHVKTAGFAEAVEVKPQTVRRGYCIDGHYMGIKPLKLPNGRLLWPVDEIRRILAGARG